MTSPFPVSLRSRVGRLLAPLVGVLAVLLALAPRGSAQTPNPLANWQYSIGDILAPLQGPLPEWRTYVGAGVTFQPLYEGSQRYRAQPVPILVVDYRELAFLSVGEGLGINLIHGRLYRAGVAISYDLGRDQHVDSRLRNLGSISPAPEVKLYADFALLPFIFDFNIRRGIGGHDGYVGDIGVNVPIPLGHNVFVFAGPSVTFADSTYMQAYFGVTEAQAAQSQFRAFHAYGGLERVGFGVSPIYQISDKLFFVSNAAVQRLMGAAARSPIVENNVEYTLNVNLVYQF